jgi:hypothetical protein
MSESLFTVFDAAFPPSSAPARAAGALGYVGAPGDATNVWSLSDWQPFAGLRQFPCWVPDFSVDADADAQAAAKAVLDRGWAPRQPDARVIVCDLEGYKAPVWYGTWARAVTDFGFTPVAYGQASTLFSNGAADNWVAVWDELAELEDGQTVHGHQYAASMPWLGTFVDLSVVDQWLLDRGGVGPRHGPA